MREIEDKKRQMRERKENVSFENVILMTMTFKTVVTNKKEKKKREWNKMRERTRRRVGQ